MNGLIERAICKQGARLASLAALSTLIVLFAYRQNAPAQTTGSSELSPELRKFGEECELLGHGRVLKLEETLRGLRSGQVKTKGRAAAIRQCETDIAEIKARERVVVPTLHFPVSAGAIGRLPGVGAHVEQILGTDEMLVRCSFRVQVVVTRHFRSEGEFVSQSVRFKVRGLPTKDFSEGSDAELLQVFRVGPPQSYRTVEGKSASVLALEPFDMQPIEKYLKAKPAF